MCSFFAIHRQKYARISGAKVDDPLKDKCYSNHLETIEALKHEIEVAIHGIEAQTIKNALKNWVVRMGYCKTSRVSHLNDYVFHS